ncbi:MAG: cation diffusion facilitator family transporter [Ketobacteraceae bacterium]|nr:cation diffusion facilitator family transporter [Ketobacteraceae bacterium]
MHNHSHRHNDSSRRIGLAFLLNVTFTVIELIGGILTNSTAIMADAVHDLGDSLSLGAGWLLSRLSGRTADNKFTYGYRRLSLLAALINGVVLMGGSAWVLIEAIPRLTDPVMPQTEGMIALALLGVAVNGFAAWRLSQGATLNEKVLNWHLLEDVLGWVAVLVVALVLQFFHWPVLDPLLSIGFTLFILINVLRNLWRTGKIFLQAAPDESICEAVCVALRNLEGVDDVHHVHLWSLDGEHHVLTAHVVVTNALDRNQHSALKGKIADILAPFGFEHTTIEIEFGEESCRDSLADT